MKFVTNIRGITRIFDIVGGLSEKDMLEKVYKMYLDGIKKAIKNVQTSPRD
jgi:hypothetical protein